MLRVARTNTRESIMLPTSTTAVENPIQTERGGTVASMGIVRRS
jgi:hypothetical protein